MNLIEQLGGYERAKHEFEMIKEMKPIYPGEIETNNRLLLEYRRQHNIFEVGDLATHLTTSAILRVVGIEDSSRHYRVIKVEALNPKNDGSVSDRFNSLWFQLKHATDEEIEAGYRLPD